MQSTDVIIVAAGSGHRFGSPLPKQFCLLDGRPVIMHTVDAFRRHLPYARITLVISADMDAYWHELCNTHGFESPAVVHGGATRWESIRNAIDAISCFCQPSDDSLIMVHDGVRPIVGADMLDRIMAALRDNPQADGAIPAVAVTDSIRQLTVDGSSVALDRASLRAVQTPQTFRAKLLCDAYRLPYSATFTDDASVMEAAGYNNLVLTEGDSDNIKITNPGDLAVASLILSRRAEK